MINILGNNTSSISLLKDPFSSDNIKEIFIHMNTFMNEKYWYGKVDFKNGNTSGSFKTKQYSVDEFHLCVQEIETLIKSL